MRARAATVEDYADFGRFFAGLEIPDPTPSLDWWTSMYKSAVFIEEAGKPIAYGLAYALGHGSGYVLHVVVDRGARNRWVGRALMRALAARLRAEGCTRWSLNVLADNAPAIALYRRAGMVVDHPSHSLMFPWTSVELLPRESLACEVLTPERDEEVERALGVALGRITKAREVPGRVVHHVDGGVIVFDPGFPGTPLFRARTPAIARTLLEAVAPHRKPEHGELRVNVENHPELSAALVALGGRVVMSMVHMTGPIVDIEE